MKLLQLFGGYDGGEGDDGGEGVDGGEGGAQRVSDDQDQSKNGFEQKDKLELKLKRKLEPCGQRWIGEKSGAQVLSEQAENRRVCQLRFETDRQGLQRSEARQRRGNNSFQRNQEAAKESRTSITVMRVQVAVFRPCGRCKEKEAFMDNDVGSEKRSIQTQQQRRPRRRGAEGQGALSRVKSLHSCSPARLADPPVQIPLSCASRA
ncbi:hypothetical protein NDA14_002988 [Ustilago hordei]|nr:hypothetical protein NDA14_002988 [Ustilago hordei]